MACQRSASRPSTRFAYQRSRRAIKIPSTAFLSPRHRSRASHWSRLMPTSSATTSLRLTRGSRLARLRLASHRVFCVHPVVRESTLERGGPVFAVSPRSREALAQPRRHPGIGGQVAPHESSQLVPATQQVFGVNAVGPFSDRGGGLPKQRDPTLRGPVGVEASRRVPDVRVEVPRQLIDLQHVGQARRAGSAGWCQRRPSSTRARARSSCRRRSCSLANSVRRARR